MSAAAKWPLSEAATKLPGAGLAHEVAIRAQAPSPQPSLASEPRSGPVTICRLGDPVAWARTQHARGGKLFTPAKQRNVGIELRIMAQDEMRGRSLMTGPVRLAVLVEFAIPASWSKRRQAAAMGALCPAYQDWDNLGKLVSDALNGVVYKDDRQVADAHIRKRYGAQPKVVITVSPALPAAAQ